MRLALTLIMLLTLILGIIAMAGPLGWMIVVAAILAFCIRIALKPTDYVYLLSKFDPAEWNLVENKGEHFRREFLKDVRRWMTAIVVVLALQLLIRVPSMLTDGPGSSAPPLFGALSTALIWRVAVWTLVVVGAASIQRYLRIHYLRTSETYPEYKSKLLAPNIVTVLIVGAALLYLTL